MRVMVELEASLIYSLWHLKDKYLLRKAWKFFKECSENCLVNKGTGFKVFSWLRLSIQSMKLKSAW